MFRQSEMGIPGLIGAPETTGSGSDSSKLESIDVAAHASSGVHSQSLDWEAKGFVTPVQSQVRRQLGGIPSLCKAIPYFESHFNTLKD